jgi:hypothetical protein
LTSSGSGESGAICTDAICGLTVPPTWLGPFRESSTPSNGSLLSLFSDANARAASCNCECGAVQDVQCGDLSIHIYEDDSCTDYSHTTDEPQPSSGAPPCIPGSSQGSIQVDSSSQFCSESVCPACSPTQELSLPPITFSATRYYSPPETAHCIGSGECFLQSSEDRICILQTGEQDCPAGYPHREIRYEDAIDSRSCSECQCSPPQGISCSATVSIHSTSTCGPQSELTSAVLEPSESSMCLGIPDGAHYSFSSSLVSAGSCAPLGGQPLGNVAASSPFTVCCI